MGIGLPWYWSSGPRRMCWSNMSDVMLCIWRWRPICKWEKFAFNLSPWVNCRWNWFHFVPWPIFRFSRQTQFALNFDFGALVEFWLTETAKCGIFYRYITWLTHAGELNFMRWTQKGNGTIEELAMSHLLMLTDSKEFLF